jgi:hypothetical protein
MVMCCGMAVKRMWMWGIECEEGEGTDHEDVSIWLLMVDKTWHALYIKWMKLIVKYFYFGGVVLDLYKYIFLSQKWFLEGLRLESLYSG